MRKVLEGGRSAGRILKITLITLLGIVIGLPALIIVLLFGIPALQDVTYARFAFGSPLGVERVVASKGGIGFGAGCTYAVVELTPARSAELLAGDEFRNAFGQQEAFRKSPSDVNPTPDDNPNRMHGCYFEGMTDDDRREIEGGLRNPGGWFSVSYNYYLFFLPKRNLIGTMSFHGD